MRRRRTHQRFSGSNIDAVLRVRRDVMVRPAAGGGFIAFSDTPAVSGHCVTVELLVEDTVVCIPTRVSETQLEILDGGVRHKLTLVPQPEPPPDQAAR